MAGACGLKWGQTLMGEGFAADGEFHGPGGAQAVADLGFGGHDLARISLWTKGLSNGGCFKLVIATGGGHVQVDGIGGEALGGLTHQLGEDVAGAIGTGGVIGLCAGGHSSDACDGGTALAVHILSPLEDKNRTPFTDQKTVAAVGPGAAGEQVLVPGGAGG